MSPPTTTTRLGLLVDPDGESAIGTQSPQWRRVDKAAGVMTTQSGVNIPNADLYEGAIVAERDTGISWRCVSNGAGGWNKVYLNYPWFIEAQNTVQSIPHNVSQERGWPNFYQGINSTAADLPSSRIRVPIKAIYSIRMTMRWASNTSGIRHFNAAINAADIGNYDPMTLGSDAGAFLTTQIIQIQKLLNANDTLSSLVYQNCGAALNQQEASASVVLIRPVA